MSQETIKRWLPFILILTLLPVVLAAPNDPGHDTLYIEETGNSELTGHLNITQNLTVSGDTLVSALTLYGDGTTPGSGTYISSASGGTDWLRIGAPGNLLLKDLGGDQVIIGSGTATDLNVTGDIYTGDVLVQKRVSGTCGPGEAIQSINAAGTVNCGVTSGASSGGGWTNNSENTSTMLNVGIGTTTPDYTLDIENNQNDLTRFRIHNTNTGTSAREGLFFEGSSTAHGGSMQFLNKNFDGGTGYELLAKDTIFIGTSSQSVGGITLNAINAAASVRIAAGSGNYGLGGIRGEFDSSGLTVTGIMNASGNVYDNANRVCTAANGLCTTAGDGTGGWTNDSTTTSTSLDVNVASGKFFVNSSNGYIGIGTSTPSTAFDMETYGNVLFGVGAASANNQLTVRAAYISTKNAQIAIDAGKYASLKLQNNGTSKWVLKGDWQDSDLFSIGGGANGGTHYLSINNADGKVGIGTDSPTQKLDVNGSGNFSGTNAQLWVNGSTVCTAANGLCTTAGDGTGGWTNDSENTSTTLNVGIGTSTPGTGSIGGQNVHIAGINPTLILDSTAGRNFQLISLDSDTLRIYDNDAGKYRLTLDANGNFALGSITDGTPDAQLEVSILSGTNTGLIVRGGVGQTGNLTEWQNNTNNTLAYVDANGDVFASDGQVCTAANGLCTTAGDGTGGWTNTSTTTSTSLDVNITARATSAVPLTVHGLSSQTGNLQEWQNSSGDAMAYVDASGQLNLNADAYGDSGGLFFAGGNTGIYASSANVLVVANGGGTNFEFTGANLRSWSGTGPNIISQAMTSTAPGYSIRGDLDTGIGWAGANNLSLITGGTEAVRIQDDQEVNFNGNVGIGTADPNSSLDVIGTINGTRVCDKSGNCLENAGTGTVNTGAANKLAYYAGAGTTVDDLTGAANGAIYYNSSTEVQSGTLPAASGGTGISGAGGSANRVLTTSDGSTWSATQVDLTNMVTGNLPDGNIASSGTWNAKAATGSSAACTYGIANITTSNSGAPTVTCAAQQGTGSGTVTSISGGTGLNFSSNPITTTGTITINNTWLNANYIGQNEYTNLDTDNTDDLTTSTNFLGDVTGNYNSMVVADNSHTHDASNITSGNLAIARMPTGGAWALSSDLNIDSNTLFINASSTQVGIGTNSPETLLEAEGQVAENVSIRVNSLENGATGTDLYTGFEMRENGGSYGFDLQYNMYSNDFELTRVVNNVETVVMMIARDIGNVGIGTTGPDRKLDVLDASNPQLRLTYADGSAYTDFQTTSAGELYINPSGSKVGIGTAAPNATLDVIGTINATGDICTTGSNCLSDIATDQVGTVTDTYVCLGQSGSIVACDDAGITYVDATDALTVTGSIDVGSSGLFANSSNVGIGTATPQMTFDVMTGVSDGILLTDSSDEYKGWLLNNANDGELRLYADGSSLTTLVSSDGDSYFTGGQVGIGTNAPNSNLEVLGTSTPQFLLSYNQAIGNSNGARFSVDSDYNLSIETGRTYPSAVSSTIKLNPGGGDVILGSNSYSDIGIGTNTPSYDLEILKNSSNGSFGISTSGKNGNIFTVDENDNVGIGIDTPTAKLDVKGNASINDTLYVTESGKVGIGTNNPGKSLDVVGNAIFNITNENNEMFLVYDYINDRNIINFDNNAGQLLLAEDGTLKVGIGTSNPQYTLDINATNNPRIRFNDPVDDDNLPGILFTGEETFITYGDDTNDKYFNFYPGYAATRTNDATIRIFGSGTSSWTEYLSLKHDGSDGIITTGAGDLELTSATGKVGIGTASPKALLDINTAALNTNAAGSFSFQSNGSIGTSANDVDHVGEFRTTAGNQERLLFYGFRRDAGSAWEGAGWRMQLAVDNSFTAYNDGKAYIELSTNSSGNGNIYFGTEGADKMIIDPNGKVGIGTAIPTQALDVRGNINVSNGGNIYYEGNLTGYGADLAENIFAAEELEAGDVVIISDTGDETVEKATVPYDTRVAGIISEDPSHLMSADEGDIPLALAGRVPIKATAENGPIKRGDLLTTSSTPGYAMRCPDRTTCVGAIVGKALEPLTEGEGKITALVMLG